MALAVMLRINEYNQYPAYILLEFALRSSSPANPLAGRAFHSFPRRSPNMESILRVCCNAGAPALTALLLSVATSSAHAVVVNIDPSQSSVTYAPGGIVFCDPSGNCGTLPEPQTFTLSGSFNVRQETVFIATSFVPLDGYERVQIRFDDIAVDSGGAATLGFTFPSYLSVLTGDTFVGNEDACTWFPSTGSCFSMGPFGEFSGMFDGSTLSMTGRDYAGDSFPSTFSFTLVAQAVEPASVPEPSTLACLAAASLGIGAMGRRRKKLPG